MGKNATLHHTSKDRGCSGTAYTYASATTITALPVLELEQLQEDQLVL
jgi:hypothetical protein